MRYQSNLLSLSNPGDDVERKWRKVQETRRICFRTYPVLARVCAGEKGMGLQMQNRDEESQSVTQSFAIPRALYSALLTGDVSFHSALPVRALARSEGRAMEEM